MQRSEGHPSQTCNIWADPTSVWLEVQWWWSSCFCTGQDWLSRFEECCDSKAERQKNNRVLRVIAVHRWCQHISFKWKSDHCYTSAITENCYSCSMLRQSNSSRLGSYDMHYLTPANVYFMNRPFKIWGGQLWRKLFLLHVNGVWVKLEYKYIHKLLL